MWCYTCLIGPFWPLRAMRAGICHCLKLCSISMLVVQNPILGKALASLRANFILYNLPLSSPTFVSCSHLSRMPRLSRGLRKIFRFVALAEEVVYHFVYETGVAWCYFSSSVSGMLGTVLQLFLPGGSFSRSPELVPKKLLVFFLHFLTPAAYSSCVG